MNDEKYEIPLLIKILFIIPIAIFKVFLWGIGVDK